MCNLRCGNVPGIRRRGSVHGLPGRTIHHHYGCNFFVCLFELRARDFFGAGIKRVHELRGRFVSGRRRFGGMR